MSAIIMSVEIATKGKHKSEILRYIWELYKKGIITMLELKALKEALI